MPPTPRTSTSGVSANNVSDSIQSHALTPRSLFQKLDEKKKKKGKVGVARITRREEEKKVVVMEVQ